MEKVALQLKKDRRFGDVLCAYLEIARPSIGEAIDICAQKSPREIRILPYFVLTGRHVKSHIPEIAAAAKKKHKNIKITLCSYLGYDEMIVRLTKKRILEAS